MDAIANLKQLGFDIPGPAYLFGAILFGLCGIAAFRNGRKTDRPRRVWLGVALMFYPYLVSNVWLLWGLGIALCAGVLLDRA